MALIKCPECGKEISDKSKQCIHCGFPLNESSNYNKAICPFSFLNDIDRSLYQRYMTVEINLTSRSNSYYDSVMDLTEEFIIKVVDSKKLFINNGSKKMVASLKEENVRKYFTQTIGIEPTIYEKIIKLGISINEHKHASERSFDYEEAINDLSLIHCFLSNYYNRELGLKIQNFDRSFYDHLVRDTQFHKAESEKQAPLYPIKGFEDDAITLQFENYKIWIKNKTLIKYIGDEKNVNLKEIKITKINSGIFNGNSSLEIISLPKTLENIEWQFRDCAVLNTVIINGELDYIKDSFLNCRALKTIDFNCKKCKAISSSFVNCGIRELEFSFDNLDAISSSCNKCNKLKTLKIIQANNSKLKIDSSFNDCRELMSVELSLTDANLNDSFSRNRNLVYFFISPGSKASLVDCLEETRNLTSLFLPSNVSDLFFAKARDVDRWFFEDSRKEFEEAYWGESYWDGDGYTEIDEDWFDDDDYYGSDRTCIFSCKNPELRYKNWLYIVVPNKKHEFIRLDKYLAKYHEDVVLPNEINGIPVEEIDSNAFLPENNHKKIVLSENIRRINSDAFCECGKVDKLELNKKLEKIDRCCFDGFKESVILDIIRQLEKIDDTHLLVSPCIFGGKEIHCNLSLKKQLAEAVSDSLCPGFKILSQNMLYTHNGKYSINDSKIRVVGKRRNIPAEQIECHYEKNDNFDLVYGFYDDKDASGKRILKCCVLDVLRHEQDKKIDLLSLSFLKNRKNNNGEVADFYSLLCRLECDKLFIPNFFYINGEDVLYHNKIDFLFFEANEPSAVSNEFGKYIEKESKSDYDGYSRVNVLCNVHYLQGETYCSQNGEKHVSWPLACWPGMEIRFGCKYDEDNNVILLHSGVPFKKSKNEDE